MEQRLEELVPASLACCFFARLSIGDPGVEAEEGMLSRDLLADFELVPAFGGDKRR